MPYDELLILDFKNNTILLNKVFVFFLTYHVVSGRLDANELEKWIKQGEGTAELTTVAGGKLWVMKKDGQWWVKDEKGGTATITIANVYQSNGVIHVVDHVLMPK